MKRMRELEAAISRLSDKELAENMKSVIRNHDFSYQREAIVNEALWRGYRRLKVKELLKRNIHPK